jgi:hypothetical protein
LKIFIKILFILISISSLANDFEIERLVAQLNLKPGMKASIQWERVFSSERRKSKYKLDTLPEHTQQKLKRYLIGHAADSEQPMLPGT